MKSRVDFMAKKRPQQPFYGYYRRFFSGTLPGLVGARGFEPPTSSTPLKRAINERSTRVKDPKFAQFSYRVMRFFSTSTVGTKIARRVSDGPLIARGMVELLPAFR